MSHIGMFTSTATRKKTWEPKGAMFLYLQTLQQIILAFSDTLVEGILFSKMICSNMSINKNLKSLDHLRWMDDI